MLRSGDGCLDFMEGTNTAVEALVMLVHNDFQSVLQLFVGLLELIVLAHQSEGASVVELESDLDGDT